MKIWNLKDLRRNLKYFVLLPPKQQFLEPQIRIFHEFLSWGQEIFHQVFVKQKLLKIFIYWDALKYLLKKPGPSFIFPQTHFCWFAQAWKSLCLIEGKFEFVIKAKEIFDQRKFLNF